MKFNESVRMNELIALPSQEEIRNTVQLYRADRDFALKNSEGAVKKFIESVPLLGKKYVSIDVKVHMLKPGWFPSIPGWHLDDFYRPDGKQPQVSRLQDNMAYHHIVLFGDSSLTEFLNEPVDLPLPLKDCVVYNFYDSLIKERGLGSYSVKEGHSYSFTSLDFHRGVAANKSGWRAFVRFTESDIREPRNEIRNQSQAYVPTEELCRGW